MNLLKKIARQISKTRFVRNAIEERADLSAFKEHRTTQDMVRNIFGLSLIILSYIICWPMIILFGVISIYLKEPLIVVIGGPVIYGLSHLIFLAGMYITGAPYTMIVFKWAARIIIEKIIGEDDEETPSDYQNEKISDAKS